GGDYTPRFADAFDVVNQEWSILAMRRSGASATVAAPFAQPRHPSARPGRRAARRPRGGCPRRSDPQAGHRRSRRTGGVRPPRAVNSRLVRARRNRGRSRGSGPSVHPRVARAARVRLQLARLYDGASALRERFGQTRGLKRLAQTLAALERKEDACHLKIWTRRKGSCPLLRELRFARSTSSC